jgi:hypothetical protein
VLVGNEIWPDPEMVIERPELITKVLLFASVTGASMVAFPFSTPSVSLSPKLHPSEP